MVVTMDVGTDGSVSTIVVGQGVKTIGQTSTMRAHGNLKGGGVIPDIQVREKEIPTITCRRLDAERKKQTRSWYVDLLQT
jgi:hypothetical protein